MEVAGVNLSYNLLNRKLNNLIPSLFGSTWGKFRGAHPGGIYEG